MEKRIEKWPNHKEFEGDTIIFDDIIKTVKTTKQGKPRLTLEKFAEEVRAGFARIEKRLDKHEEILMRHEEILNKHSEIFKRNNLN